MNNQPVFEQAAQWLSRTLAILIFMVGPGWLGSLLDQRWGTSYLAPGGFALGMLLATAALVLLARKLAPPARGRALPWDDESTETEADSLTTPPSDRPAPRPPHSRRTK